MLTSISYFHIFGNMKQTDAIAALGALAQATRLDIFRYLVQVGPDGVPAGQIGERVGLPSATLSFHLNTLKYAGLVERKRHGRSIIYAACFATMTDLLNYLTENCCAGQPENCAVPALQIRSKTRRQSE